MMATCRLSKTNIKTTQVRITYLPLKELLSKEYSLKVKFNLSF